MSQVEIRNNTITGLVRTKETKNPLKNLLVIAYDLDPGWVNPDGDETQSLAIATVNNAKLREIEGDRLGSVLTDDNGGFTIEYQDDAFQIRQRARDIKQAGKEARPDLFLVIATAEEESKKKFENIIFYSKWIRTNAGRDESYVVEIETDKLKEFDYFFDSDDSEDTVEAENKKVIKNKVAPLSQQLVIDRGIRNEIAATRAQLDEEDSEDKKEIRTAIRQSIFKDIGSFGVGNNLVRFVQPDETIDKPQKEIYDEGIKKIEQSINIETPLPGEGIKISVYLTEKDVEAFEDYKFEHNDNSYFNIPEDEIQRVLFTREDDEGVNAILFSDNPISRYCRSKSVGEKCADKYVNEKDDIADSGDDQDADLEMDASIIGGETEKDDIPALLGTVMFRPTDDIFSEQGLVAERPNADSVQSNVDSFSLQKGPADATAFYDFETLNIAFPHVWKQLVDETLVDVGEKVHFGLKNQGKKGLWNVTDVGLTQEVKVPNFTLEGILWNEPIPATILKYFDISELEYDAMTPGQQGEILNIAERINGLNERVDRLYSSRRSRGRRNNRREPVYVGYDDIADRVEVLFNQGEMLLENVRLNNPNSTNALIKDLHDRLKSKHEFTIFAADKDGSSVNFGMLNTYRQKWEPVSYQAGQLAKTLTMAPKQEVKVSVETKRNLKASEKEANKHNSTIDSESNLTSKSESEIVAKAQKKSEFDFNVDARYTQSSVKLGLGKDAAKDSSEAKKSFRESVLKAAQEFKDEWQLDVSTEESYDVTESTTGTIVNPNEELSVTYLFYQLQRRYRVSEQLYRTSPVVLVALEVPAPDEITEGWVIAHDWVINRVLLDDSFRDALEMIANRNTGDTFALRELRKNLREQRRLMRSLESEFSKLEREVQNKYQDYQDAIEGRIETEHYKRKKKYYRRGLFSGYLRRKGLDGQELGITDFDPEMAKAFEQAAADDHQHAVEKAKQLSMSVQREQRTLNELTRDYNEAMEEHLNMRVASKRLLTHIKENILYYMQAIWRMEPTDQRFMRLHKVKVPDFTATRTCILEVEPSDDLFEKFRKDGKKRFEGWLHAKIDRENGQPDVEYKALVEVADIDTVLGFKGNYIMFPLKKHNALTELMAAPYVDEAFGAMDPDQLSNINLEEYSKFICCLHEEDPEQFEEWREVLHKWLGQLLSDPLRNGDEIIVPTDSLFIEMLPSDTTLLEDFKLKHRAMDVMKVRAEVRQMELENVRYAARLLSDQNDDPAIDKSIIVHGAKDINVSE